MSYLRRPQVLCASQRHRALSLPRFKCRALVLAACELVLGLLLRGLSQSGRGHIEVALCKSGQREMSLKITGSGLGTMREPPSDSLADLAELLESDLLLSRALLWSDIDRAYLPIANQDDRCSTLIAD